MGRSLLLMLVVSNQVLQIPAYGMYVIRVGMIVPKYNSRKATKRRGIFDEGEEFQSLGRDLLDVAKQVMVEFLGYEPHRQRKDSSNHEEE